MMDEERRQAIRDFFTQPRPHVHVRTLVVGGCAAFLGVLSAVSGEGGAGLVLAGLGTLYALALPVRTRAVPGEELNEAQYVSLLQLPGAVDRYRSRRSPDQVRAWLTEDVARIADDSKDRLGLDETTRDPICVLGPVYSERVEGIEPNNILRRKVPNGYLYSVYRISVFQFSDRLLGAYQCHFDLVRNVAAAEQTAEFFYRDVVSVRTVTESSNQVLKTGETLTRSRVFSLTTAGGEQIRIVLDDPVIQAGEDLRSLGDEAAANIRAMLRQYKAPLQDAS